ncbi:prolyl oligopeptidase family protein [Asticcacaulis biprosthecium C19]|uniref:Prolyl oligopeptidase family protein n=1 Tax=Asticcacaulis biprosthecium C19 TaxID=715226 RepID=F4QRM2_9CAUL|nr:prolyl oligopeptidase family serine peptidase [Asticcacaulis biprosthecium]EGF90148.1 prolyl oligopeptidase family protein [Asticcacaulis biprosthecium C19]
MARSPINTAKSLIKSVAVAAILAGAGSQAWAAYTPPAKPLAIEDIARFEMLTSLSIAPDGKHIAGMVAVDGQKWPVISIWDTSDLARKPVWIPTQTNRITEVGFFTSDKIYFVMEQPITGNDGKPTFTNKLYYSDLEGRKIEEPFRLTGTMNKDVRDAFDRTSVVDVFNDHLYDANKKLMVTVDPVSFDQKIFELDLTTGKTRTVAIGSEKYTFDPQGVDLTTGDPKVKSKTDVLNGEFWHMVYIKEASGQWVYHEPLSYKIKERITVNILGYDTDPSNLIVSSSIKSDKAAIYSYNIATKTYSAEPLFANDKFAMSGVVFRPDRASKTTTIEGVKIAGPVLKTVYLDEKWAAIQKSLEATFPGRNVDIDISSFGQQTAVVTVHGADFVPQYYLYKDGKLTGLGGQRPWIDPATLGKAEFVTFKARDSLDIPAIITLPPGWTPEQGPVPVIVLPHGGPWSRDVMTWDGTGWEQFYATRGIAVIQPQYRGSIGWGTKLWLAGDKEWGQKMSDDNDDAAAYMVSRGIGDPKRMAIMGYSYGGFAAIAASVRPNSPYKCAIAGAGVSSLQRLGNLWGDNHLAREYQGKTVDGMDPLENVRNANIPIMLYHGDHDRQADTEHSRMFYSAMKAAGKDIEYHEIKGMWHTLPWNPAWHQQSLKLIEDYLKGPKCGLIR